ncbi:MAG: hypothetical protein MJ198_04940 [Bacteroidales bacterium]|nr:hypothetical protein [Bacteroidales bacterium]
MIIAVDFDNTIAITDFPRIFSPRPGVIEALHKLRQQGHYIIVWTCRCDNDLLNAINFMKENDIEFDRINDNHPDNVRTYGGNSRKINADIYIDDKNLGGFEGWYHVMETLITQ